MSLKRLYDGIGLILLLYDFSEPLKIKRLKDQCFFRFVVFPYNPTILCLTFDGLRMYTFLKTQSI